MITHDQAQFFANLRLTQAYCQQQLKHEKKPEWVTLRSIVNPVCKDGEWFAHLPSGSDAVDSDNQSILWKQWTKMSDPYYHESFVELFNKQLDYKRTVALDRQSEEIYQGKILVVEYGENIPDGAAEAETESFFDEFDLPPIDTWFYRDYSIARGGVLFAWIPERFVAFANTAIDVQFLGIFHWFEEPSNWRT